MSFNIHLPYFAQGTVVSGYGRGSKELGIPTANLPNDVVSQLPQSFQCGVYFGWASVDGIEGIYKMVLSIGKNVFYGNEVKTMETHIIQKFNKDFYGQNLRVVILGFIRPMHNFTSLDALIKAIQEDIEYAETCLTKQEYQVYQHHPFFKTSNSSSPKVMLGAKQDSSDHNYLPINKKEKGFPSSEISSNVPIESDIGLSFQCKSRNHLLRGEL